MSTIYLSELQPTSAIFTVAIPGGDRVIQWENSKPFNPIIYAPTPHMASLPPYNLIFMNNSYLSHSLWAHPSDYKSVVSGPSSSIIYNLHKEYYILSGAFGVAENSPGFNTALTFCVLCDNELIFRSENVVSLGIAANYNLIIDNCDKLELLVISSTQNIVSCEAIWVEPILTFKSK